jgi:hypothetical protein
MIEEESFHEPLDFLKGRKEIAEVLRCTVWKVSNTKGLPVFKFGGDLVSSRKVLQEWINHMAESS